MRFYTSAMCGHILDALWHIGTSLWGLYVRHCAQFMHMSCDWSLSLGSILDPPGCLHECIMTALECFMGANAGHAQSCPPPTP